MYTMHTHTIFVHTYTVVCMYVAANQSELIEFETGGTVYNPVLLQHTLQAGLTNCENLSVCLSVHLFSLVL